ncbi:MAG: sel1 repeat family protein [Magnetococcus sp. YQC-5]
MNTQTDLSTLPTFIPGLYDLDEGEYTATLTTLAEWGDAKAQHNLGAMYLEGLELPRDYTAAMEWFLLAAQQGHAQAQHDIGVLYLEGLGVEPDPAMAAKWFLAAANQNDPKAQNNLGILCATGEGVPQDIIQARMWFLLAWRGGLTDAAENLDLSAEEMTTEEMAQAEQLATAWLAS